MSQHQRIPEGAAAIFFIQLFATVAYAVLYSTLVLYMTEKLHLPAMEANLIMGGFLAFNYGLHLLGGCFGGRLLSYRTLFVISMLMQLVSCVLLSHTSLQTMFWGLGLFLTSSGLNVTCSNMMVTQLFDPTDKRRESVFLWNYSGMNLGFLLGYTIAGYYQLTQNFHKLFLLTAITGALSVILVLLHWPKLRDRTTSLATLTEQRGKAPLIKRAILGLVLIALMVPCIHWLLMHSKISNEAVISIGILVLFTIIGLALREKNLETRKKIYAYIILTVGALLFWAMYELIPMGLTVFAEYNVNRNLTFSLGQHVMHLLVAPQWIVNINTFTIIFGGPLMVIALRKVRQYIYFSIPVQFSLALLFIGVGFIILPIGIHAGNAQGYMAFSWIFWSYIFQSIGELLISPIGYAMIGQLAPVRLQGMFMGTWMMTTGIGGIIASYASNYALPTSNSTNPLDTNAGYAHMFGSLGWMAIVVGLILACLIPFLRKLINEAHA